MVILSRVVRLSRLAHLVHDRVSPGGDPQCDLAYCPISHLGDRWVSGHGRIPGAARLFSMSNDVCASDGATLSAAFCISDCANASPERDIKLRDRIKRRDFMVHSPSSFCLSLLSNQPICKHPESPSIISRSQYCYS